MTKLRSRLLLGSVLALAGTLALAGALLTVENRPAFRLPDGTRLQIDGLEYAAGGPMVYGPAWKRRLRPLVSCLPENLAAPLEAKSVDLGGRRPKSSLTVWLEHQGDWGAASPFCVLRDSHGCRYRSVENAFVENVSLIVDSGAPHPCCFPFFPRREASFQLDAFLAAPQSRRVGSHTIPTAATTRHPTWSAETLPVTRRSGPLSVTLKEVTTGWSWETQQRPAREDELEATRLGFQLPESDRDWKVAGVKLSDATGGSYEFGFGNWSSRPGSVFVPGNNLCRQEPAYRYQLEFSRVGAMGVLPDRHYSLGSLEVDSQFELWKEILALPNGRSLGMCVVRSGSRQILYGKWTPGVGEWGRLWVEGRQEHRSWLATAETADHSPGAQTFRLELPPDLSQPQLHFGIYRSRFVTFTVKPRWIVN